MRHEAAVVDTPSDLSRRDAETTGAADPIRLHASCVAIDGRGVLDNRAVFDPMATPHRRVDDRGLAHLRALYRGEIAWTLPRVPAG